jgi:hypothetical protein
MAFLFLLFTVALSLCVVGLIVLALRDDWRLKKPKREPRPGTTNLLRPGSSSASRVTAFDTVAASRGYCMYEFEHIPEMMNASMVFGVPPSVVCECVAPQLARQTADGDLDFIPQNNRMPQHLKDAFSQLFQACLTAYKR